MIPMTDATNALAWRRQMTAFAYRNASDLFAAETAALSALGAEVRQARLLDIGIGTGRTTGHLAPRAASYVGVDYSPEMVKRARDRFAGLDLRVMDARDLSAFGSAAFDLVVFSYNGIDYVGHGDRLKILAQIFAVLRPGGAFLFSAHLLGTKIPPASALTNLGLSANPARLAGGLVKYAQGIRNARRLKPLERHEHDYALLNDSAQQYQLLTYYISRKAQARQLVDAGFEQIRAFAQSGQEMAAPEASASRPSHRAAKTDGASDYMVHYLARRPAKISAGG
jgi:SAM-dependent methyltransferase